MDEDVSIESCILLDFDRLGRILAFRYWPICVQACQSQNEKPPITGIYRIPQMLRDNNKVGKYYKPRFVSIGVYHYGNPTLREGQILKHIIAKKFVSNDWRQIQVLYDKLLDTIDEVRECYDKNSISKLDECWTKLRQRRHPTINYHFDLQMDSRYALGMMMLFDGCFVLYYIKCVVEERISRSDLKMIGHVIAIVQEDLFLLENQLPFFVLRLLMRNSTAIVQEDLFLLENQLPFFVLRLLMRNSTILTEDQWMQKISMFIQKNIMTSEKNEVEPLNYEMERPANLLELLHQRMVDPAPGSYKYTQSKPERFTFPSLKQLTAVGIQLKPGHTNRLTEIDYDSSTATLKIPSITVDDSTKSKLLNLIAYEMCPETQSDLVFITYVFLMDLFIRDPDDVKELCSANILHNFLHSDGEVAQLFNETGANWGLVPLTYKRENFLENLQTIQDDYEDKKKGYMNKMRRYREELRAGYFKNPWTIFALIGALLGLFLTGIQTYFQVWPRPSDCESLCKHIKMTHHI